MAVNKVLFNGSPVIDLTGVTVAPETLLSGYTAHDATGSLIVGTLDGTATDSSVPVGSGVSRVNYAGNALVDLTSDTVVPGALLTGVTAYSASGVLITGVFEPGVDVESMQISYTGNYTDEIKTMSDGKTYRLLTLTGSGTLTLAVEVIADIWICGGGSSGRDGDYYSYSPGGAGAYAEESARVTVKNLVVAVGAQNAATSVTGDISLSVTAVNKTHNGGTGGGADGGGQGGKGDGKSKVPFGETALYQHCAGGGGGAYMGQSTFGHEAYKGGAGGSNGANGGRSQSASGSTIAGGAGGTRGGGAGGQVTSSTARNGSAATFYGSGGGSGGVLSLDDDEDTGNGGAGYQGVAYIRIPLDQAA